MQQKERETKVGGKSCEIRNNKRHIVRAVEAICKSLQNIRAAHDSVLHNLRHNKLAVLQLIPNVFIQSTTPVFFNKKNAQQKYWHVLFLETAGDAQDAFGRDDAKIAGAKAPFAIHINDAIGCCRRVFVVPKHDIGPNNTNLTLGFGC